MSQKDKSKRFEGSCQKAKQGKDSSKLVPTVKSPVKSRSYWKNMFARRPSADTRETSRVLGIPQQDTLGVSDAPPPYPNEDNAPIESPPRSPAHVQQQAGGTPGDSWSFSDIIPPDARDFMKVESVHSIQDIDENIMRRAYSQPRLAPQEPRRSGSSKRQKRQKHYRSFSAGLNEQGAGAAPSPPLQQSIKRQSGHRGSRGNDCQHHHGDPSSPPIAGTVINVTTALSPGPPTRSTSMASVACSECSMYPHSPLLAHCGMTDCSQQNTTRCDHLAHKYQELENKLDALQVTCDNLFWHSGCHHNSGYESHLPGGVAGGVVSLLETKFQEQVDLLKCYNSKREAKMKADLEQIAEDQRRLRDGNEQLKRLIFYKPSVPQTLDPAPIATYQYGLQAVDTLPSYTDLESLKVSIHVLCGEFLSKLQEVAKRLPLNNSPEATALPQEVGKEVQRLQVAVATLQQEVAQSQQRMMPGHPFHHQHHHQGRDMTRQLLELFESMPNCSW